MVKERRFENLFTRGDTFEIVDRQGLPCKLKIEDAYRKLYRISLDGQMEPVWFLEEYIVELKSKCKITYH